MDSISDFLTVVRNASRAGKEKISVPSSRMVEDISRILKEEKFIDNYKVIEDGPKKFMRLHLRYLHDGTSAIKQLKKISRPGLRKYVSADQIPSVLGGVGISIISTSSGVMSGKTAKNKKIGGELICKVW